MHKTGSWLQKRLRRVRPAQVVVLSFALLILLGAVLLTLPISSAAHTPTGFLTCLFTATSATCVTGLIVVDTGLYWSTFGKVVIIVLIQIGGLGFMTLVSVFFVMLGKRIGLRQRMLLAQALSLDEMQGAIGMVLRILRGTAVIEGTGALILTLRFLPDYGFPRALWYGIFHAISAFCNAGFDILGDVSLGGSIIRYQKDPVVCITLMALITLGGLGFLVWTEVLHSRKKCPGMYTRLVLALTAGLFVLGTALTALLEWNNPATLGPMTVGQKLLAAAFQSVTTRTAGFAAIPQQSLTDATLAVSTFLMFIGGSSGSTAGGLKTVTFAVVLLAAISAARGRSRVTVMRRTIPQTQVMQALSLFLLMLTLSFSGAIFLSAESGCSFLRALYETVSAIATVGLTADLTPRLNALSHIILILFMFFGRVGIMTISLGFLSARREEERFTYANARVLIG